MSIIKFLHNNCIISLYIFIEYLIFMPTSKERLESIQRLFDRFGHYAVEAFHYLALFIIGCMIAWSAVHTVIDILTVKKYATIDDILLYLST